MAKFFQTIGDFFYYVFKQITSMDWVDILDIILVTVLIYYVFHFVRQRRAGKLALGVIILLFAMALSSILGMGVLSYLLQMVFDVGLIAIIVIFQPELRSALEKVGGNLRSLKNITELDLAKEEKMVEELLSAVKDLSESHTGALIVLERTTRLGDEIRTGVEVDAAVTKPLIENIFYNKAPLHDGAMIIRDNRIHACGCFLPLSGNPSLPLELGTRHRAALGVSEISDAFVLVVSEETGGVSIAKNGEMDQSLSLRVVRHRLINELGLGKERKKSIIKRKGAEKNGDQASQKENG
ncbi:MAG: diadenylate cyclase CdaA [Clostridia bacterium]|nr:diadenylate cyclase CdaA [Clostridia bacterium]